MTQEIHRTLGEHAAEISGLKEDMREVKADVKTILSILSEAKGGWKTVSLIAGISSVITVSIGKFVAILGWLPR